MTENIKKLKLSFVEILGAIEEESVYLSDIAEFLKSPDEDVVMAALSALQNYDDTELMKYIPSALNHSNPKIRELGYKCAFKFNAPENKDNMFNALKDENPWVRRLAVQNASKFITDSANLRKIYINMLDDSDENVETEAVKELAKIEDNETVNALLKKLKTAKSRIIISAIINALAKFKKTSLLYNLYETLFDKSSTLVKIAFVKAMALNQEIYPDFKTKLFEILNTDCDKYLKANVLLSLNFKTRDEIAKAISFLDTTDEVIIRSVTESLSALLKKDPKIGAFVIDELVKANKLRSSYNSRSETNAFKFSVNLPSQLKKSVETVNKFLSKMDKNLFFVFLKLLKDPKHIVKIKFLEIIKKEEPEISESFSAIFNIINPWMRTEIINYFKTMMLQAKINLINNYRINLIDFLRKSNYLPAADILKEMLEEETDVNVITACITALGHFKSAGAARVICRFAESKNWLIRNSAASALGIIQSKDTMKILIKLSRDKNSWVRFAAVDALKKLGNTVPAEVYYPRLEDEDSRIRATAVMALGFYKNPELYDKIKKLLLDENERVRSNTVESIGLLIPLIKNDQKIRKDIKPLFNDTVSRVKATAARVLYNSLKDEAVKLIKEMLTYGSINDKISALWVLGETVDSTGVALAFEALYDEEEKVRKAAISALKKVNDKSLKEIIISNIKAVEDVFKFSDSEIKVAINV